MHRPEQTGIAMALAIGQHVRHRDYKGRRVTGTVTALAVEDRALMATIALDHPIVIQAGEQQPLDLWSQHVPAHELSPFDARDELIAEMLEALRGVVRVADRTTVEFDAARTAIARAEGGVA